jgi:hypothetical protein
MDGFEKVRPSWKKIKNEKVKKTRREIPKVTFSSTLNKDGTSVDRIGFNKASCLLLDVTKTIKCELFVHKKDKKICIVKVADCDTIDTFTLSYSKENSCIRRKELFSLLDISQEIIKLLREKPFISALYVEDNMLIFDLPGKSEKEAPYSVIVDPDVIHSNRKKKSTDMPVDMDLIKALQDL